MTTRYWKRDALTLGLNDDGHDEAVNAKDTRHDDGDERLEDHVGAQDTNLRDTNASLASAVGSAHVAEHEGRRDSHVPEEGVQVGVVV